MPPQARPLVALICDPDMVSRAAVAQTVEADGFVILDKVDNGPHLITGVELQHPTLVVIANELSGMLGYEVIDVITRLGLDEPPEMILISADPAIAERALDAGALAVIPKSDLEALQRAISDAKLFLETGERRTSSDRRDRADRREHQDWSKVTHERRDGADRRAGDRREDNGTVIDDLTD